MTGFRRETFLGPSLCDQTLGRAFRRNSDRGEVFETELCERDLCTEHLSDNKPQQQTLLLTSDTFITTANPSVIITS